MSSKKLPTHDLIEQLAQENTSQVKRPRSGLMAFIWFFISFFVVVFATRFFGFQPHFLEQLDNPRFVVELLLGLVIIVSSVAVAFKISRPGEESTGKYWVLLFIALWVAAVTLTLWPLIQSGKTAGVWANITSTCFSTVFFLAIIPGAILFWMIRKLAPTSPCWTGALATLSGATLGTLILESHCVSADYLHTLLAHMAPVVFIMLIGALLGGWLLRW